MRGSGVRAETHGGRGGDPARATYGRAALQHLRLQPTQSPAPRLGGSRRRITRRRVVLFTLNTILIILLLCFMYPIAFRALLNVFVIRIPIVSH